MKIIHSDRRDKRNSNKMLFLPPIGERRASFGPSGTFHNARQEGPNSGGSSNFLSKRIGKAATLKGKSLKGEPEKRRKRKKNKSSSSASRNSNFQNAFLPLKKRNNISSSLHGIITTKKPHNQAAPSKTENNNANRIKSLIRGVFEDLEEMDTLALMGVDVINHGITSSTSNTGANTVDDNILVEPLTLAFNLTPDSNGELQIDGPIEELDPDLGSLLLPACFR